MKRRRDAFTLVETLVTVLILNVLVATALPVYQSATRRASIRVVQENMHSIAVAAEGYRARQGYYPANFTNLQQDGSGAPADFIGPNGDLSAVPQGPHHVWYYWNYDRTQGFFRVTAVEGGEQIWGTTPNINSKVYYNLKWGRFYVQNGTGTEFR